MPLQWRIFQHYGDDVRPVIRTERDFSTMTGEGSPSEIKGKLSEERVNGIFDERGKTRPESVMMTMGKTEVLLDDIANSGDGLVPCNLKVSQDGSFDGLSHDPVSDAVHGEKGPVGFTVIPFVGIHLFDRVSGMTAAGDTQGKTGTVMMGCGTQFRGKKKAIAGIDGGMLLQSEMGKIILDRPIRFKVPGKLKRVSVLVHCALRRLSLFLFFFQFFSAEGPTGRLDQAGVHGDALVDGKSSSGELVQQFAVNPAQGSGGQPSSETGEGGMIGGRIIKGKSEKRLEGDPVIDLGFPFRVGIDREPLLEQETFHQENRRIGRIAFTAVSDGIGSHEQGFNTGPVNDSVDLFHALDGPVLFH